MLQTPQTIFSSAFFIMKQQQQPLNDFSPNPTKCVHEKPTAAPFTNMDYL